MRIIDDSKITETLHQGRDSTVYRFLDEEEYVLKTLQVHHGDQGKLLDFNLEYDILEKMALDRIPRVVGKGRFNNNPVIILKFIPGVDFKAFLKSPLAVEAFLPIAIQIVDIVSNVHQKKIIHNDIKPDNILIDKDGHVHLIDFGSATRLSKINVRLQSPKQIKGTISYMAPEAFGRMNRHVDNRSDLYSVGILFFEMLTGRLPFQSDDELELIHAHMAIQAEFDGISSPLDEIIKKLLAKTPEQRYQSAEGLKHDLVQCQELLSKFGQILSFPIGTRDYSSNFRIPQKLYGRDEEIKLLLDKFDYISEGNTHLLLVTGYSGIGKTALVNETHKPITKKNAYFLSGKFDQYQRDVPYDAIVKAFDQFIDQLLKEPQTFLNNLARDILEAIGSNGQLIIDLIPSVEFIIGPQKAIVSLPPVEAQNRFIITFLSFIKVFASEKHPLVLMIDDLQWSDQASLDMLSNLILDDSSKHILVIGAYRDNEVDAAHPLILALDKLSKKTSEVSQIKLKPLKHEDVLNLISDTLKSPVDKSKPLSDLIYEKTNGNPFFVGQFLRNLYDNGLVRFDHNSFVWQWEIQVIKALNITDNVVEMMMGILDLLPESCKELIRLSACIGNTFNLDTLSAIAEKEKITTASLLWPAVESGLIQPEGQDQRVSQINAEVGEGLENLDFKLQYQFAHDRIQQAAYALIPEEDRESIHLRIGRLLLEGEESETPESSLFEIMGHINIGKNLVGSEPERIKYAELNLLAGRKAKKSLAHDTAISYLSNGIDFMGEDSWKKQDNYSLIYDLYVEKAEATYLTGDYGPAEDLVEDVLNNASSPGDMAKVYLLKGILNTSSGDLVDALTSIKNGLKYFGLEIPEKVTPELIGASLADIQQLLGEREISDLFDLPEMQGQDGYMKTLFLAIGATPAFFLDKSLWVWVIAQLVKIAIEEGHCDISDLGYSAFGLFIGSSMGMYTEGYEYGSLAMRLNQKYNKTENLAKLGVIFGQLVSPWKAHIRENVPYAQEGFRAGVETGDLIYAAYNTGHMCWNHFLLGSPLAEVKEQIDKVLHFFERITDDMGNTVLVVQRLCKRLASEELTVLLGDNEEDEKQFLDHISNIYNEFPLSTYYVAKIRLCYFSDDFTEVNRLMPEFLKVMHSTLGMALNTDAYLFHSLALCQLIAQEESSDLMADLKRNIAQLEVWSNHAPMNYRYRYELVLAEKARCVDKNFNLAEEKYDLAIKFSNENGFTHDEALCTELAARFYLERRRDKIARTYMNDAVHLYHLWGARSKVVQLAKTYPELITAVGDLAHTNTLTRSSSSGLPISLDWRSLIKATSMISGEMKLESLLDKFMDILIETAGAERCFIIYQDIGSDAFYIEAEASVQLEENKVLQHQALDKEILLCQEIVQYVNRTGKTLVIDAADKDPRFRDTEYVRTNKPKSILAIKFVLQNKNSGVIYMENNLATAAFSSDRVEFIGVLAAQVSISLENALLYRDLEDKVRERTTTIEEQNEIITVEKSKSDELLYNILPRATADELKRSGQAVPKYFEQVSILFTDFKGFTQITEGLTPEQLIENLGQCFLAFDEIAEKNHLEKIKTIGDSYMCASGVPLPSKDHALNAAMAGLEIQSFVKKWNALRVKTGKEPWPLRIGIHSGSVIAGVVGSKKFAYDIWGDAVNIASRMESSGEVNEVNISASTYELIKDQFETVYRGEVMAKSKGAIPMYFVKGVK